MCVWAWENWVTRVASRHLCWCATFQCVWISKASDSRISDATSPSIQRCPKEENEDEWRWMKHFLILQSLWPRWARHSVTLRSSGDLGKYPARWGQLPASKIAKRNGMLQPLMVCTVEGNQSGQSGGSFRRLGQPIEYVMCGFCKFQGSPREILGCW